MEEVDNNTLISNKMLGPSFFACQLVRFVVGIRNLNIWLLRLAVKVLTQKVKHRVDALLRIMLAISFELLSVASKYLFEHGGSDHRLISVPHFIEEFGKCLYQATLSAQRVVLIQVSLEALIQEVLGELPAVAEALQAAVHVASVPEVAQSDTAVPGSGTSLEAGYALFEFCVCQGTAGG